ncbi:MAG: hypothetical protein ACI837_003173 [Crocinitomicaceae bacterium]|jgi:hypothetical protein
MNHPCTVALVEVAGSHDECLLSQLAALKERKRRVLMVCNKRIRDRNPHFNDYVDEWLEVDFVSKAWKDFMIVRRMMKEIKKRKVSHVVFNTAQGGIVRNAVLLSLFSKVKFIGIVHTIRKFQGSFTQKLINWKIKNYFLLSDHLMKKVEAPKGIKLKAFYPLRFLIDKKLENDQKLLQITIIGGVENRRKDLDGFVEMLAKVETNVRFVFLGKSDPTSDEVKHFRQKLEDQGLIDKVTLFEEFVSHEVFSKQLQQTDAILPLIHPETESAEEYFNNQIAGAMIVAFSYKIPLLLHTAYESVVEMQTASIYYELPDFPEALTKLAKHKNAIVENMKNHEPYQQEIQEASYASFVLGDKSAK